LETDPQRLRATRRAWLILLVIAATAAVAWGDQHAAPFLLTLARDIRALGMIAPVAFVLLYGIAVALLIPATVLTVAGGALFGFWIGVVCGTVGGTLGSAVAFLLGRYTMRRFVVRRLASMPRYQAIERAVSAQGLRIVFLLRLSPVVPFNFLNYGLGVTEISLSDFIWAGAGTLPGSVVYAYFGKVTGEALVLAGQTQMPHGTSYYVALVAGLVATVAATTVVAQTARRALRDV
jgi:uncharacterized membrane protein YdjX (TVP38/TMEM64 family)